MSEERQRHGSGNSRTLGESHGRDTVGTSERAQLEKYRAIFDYANDAIFMMDSEIFIECNAKTLDVFGCQCHDEMIGHAPWEFSPPQQPDGSDSRAAALAHVQAALKGHPQRFHWQHSRHDGTPFDAEVTLTKLSVGPSYQVLAIVRDVSIQVQAERCLRESQKFIESVTESSPDIIYVVDVTDGRLVYRNRSLSELLGYTESETVEHGLAFFRSLVHPDDIGRLQKTLASWNDVDDKEIVNSEVRVRAKDGRWRWFRLREKVFQRNEDGSVRQIIGSGRDITVQYQTQGMLRLAVNGTAGTTGTKFFHSLVHHMAMALDVCFAFVGKFASKEQDTIEILACWPKQDVCIGQQYPVGSSPLQACSPYKSRVIRSGAVSQFPDDEIIARVNAESFAGIMFADSSGASSGILGVMDNRPLPKDLEAGAKHLLSIFAVRASAELERLRVEDELREAISALAAEHQALTEKHSALTQVLEHLNEDKTLFREEIRDDIDRAVRPNLTKLRRRSAGKFRQEIDTLEACLNSVLKEGLDDFSRSYGKLTPREMDICECIRQGMSSKETAAKLNIELQTVQKHRSSIRRKLGLAGSATNLSSYLRSK